MGGNALGSAVSIESSSLYLGSEEFTSTVQLFFQSEVNQIAAQIPDAFVQLVYQPVKAANWFVVAQSGQVWLDSETNFWERLGLEESWLDTLPPSELSELPLQSEKWGYMYPLYCSDQVSCLLLGTSQPLSTMQRQVIDKSIQSLNEYLGLFQKYRHQKVLVQSLIQTFHHIEHQIRQPLALIEIYTEILSSQLQKSEWRSQISSIQAAVKELSAHLKELTVCNQLQSTKPHSTKNPLHDLCMILAEALEGLQPWIAQKHLKIQHSLESAMLNVNAWQLKQVFNNLLDNAIQFSPENGTISCYWQVFHQEVLVEIWDEGSGLSEEDLRQVFTPFYSRRPGGTGLGLAIAQKIILDHRGRLWVENLPHQGAKFSFVLPRW